jgi:ABC-type amino acid transport substrate-binding protein
MSDAQKILGSRRAILTGGLAVGSAAMIAACSSTAPSSGSTSASDDLLQRIIQDKKVRLGVDLTFAPLQFRDDSDQPTGYSIELTKLIFDDLGVEIEWVEMEFSQLFAGLVADRFDMAGIPATILPSRAQQVLFSTQPAFIESNVILQRPGLSLRSESDLNNPDITIAVLAGSSQEAAVPLLYPNARTKSLGNQEAIQDVASGQSDVSMLSEFNIADALEQYPNLTVLPGPSSLVDVNTYFVPAGQFGLKSYIDNSLLYLTSHGTLAGLWNRWIGDAATAAGLPTVPVRFPYLAGAE